MTEACKNCGMPTPPPGRLLVDGIGAFPNTEGVEQLLAEFYRKRRQHALAMTIATIGWLGFFVLLGERAA